MSKEKSFKINWEILGVLIAIFAIMLFTGIMQPIFFEIKNISNILRQISGLALVAFAMTPIIISGGIDLSPASVIALVGIVIAKCIVAGIWLPLALALGVLTGLLCGVFNGFLIGYLKLPPFIATLGTQSMVGGLAFTITGGVPVTGLKDEVYKFVGSGNIAMIPTMFYIVIVFFIITYYLMRKTRRGVYTYAVGGNETVAVWAGIDVKLHKLLIYTYGGFLVGLAGLILGARVNSGQPSLATGIELQAIAATCIGGTSMAGGKGSIVGTLLGIFLIGLLNNALNLLGISTFIQEIIIGAVIVVAVLLSLNRK